MWCLTPVFHLCISFGCGRSCYRHSAVQYRFRGILCHPVHTAEGQNGGFPESPALYLPLRASHLFCRAWRLLWLPHWETPPNMVMVHLASGYGDIPVAAYGVVKRIDQFPLNVSMGPVPGLYAAGGI